ncbi:MAG: hypothetical protein ACO2ZP_08855 [Bacteriovoracaceae bacterium]
MLALSFFIPFITPSIHKYKWLGPKPHKSLWKIFCLKNKTNVFPDGEFKHLTYVDLLYFGGTNYIFKNGQLYFRRNVLQHIKQNNQEDQELLNQGMGWFMPHEVFKLKVETSIGSVIESDIIHKTIAKGPQILEIIREIKKIELRVKKQNIAIKTVHLIHTHPSLEIGIKKGNKWTFYRNGLSQADLTLGELLHQRLKYNLCLKAITPNGINYNYKFKNNK